MKNQKSKIKNHSLLLILAFIISIFALSNCEKNDDKGIRIFLSGGSPFDLQNVTLSNGMIIFTDTAALNKLDADIESFNDDCNNDTTLICDADTGYIAFENQIGFQGLRYSIESETSILEQNDNLFSYNDPDDHFIFDDFYRTILNQKLKFGIGASIYKFINDFIIIEVIDNPSLMTCIDINVNGGDLKPCLVNSSINIIMENIHFQELRAQYAYTVNSTTFSFTNTSVNASSFYWDFGDGTTSTLENPTHTYTGQGPFDVVLVVEKHIDNGDIIYDKTSQVVRVTGDCIAKINYDVNDDNLLEVEFTDGSIASANSQLYSWDWNFGDGSNSTQQNPTHTYASKGEYTVILIIRDLADCSKTVTVDITVGQDQGCIAYYDFKDDCFYSYDDKDYKVKIRFKLKNRERFGKDLLMAKVRHYRVGKILGCVYRKRASYITASIIGTVYKEDSCNSSNYIIFKYSDPLTTNLFKKSKAKAKYTHQPLSLIPANVYATFYIYPIKGETFNWHPENLYFKDDTFTCPD